MINLEASTGEYIVSIDLPFYVLTITIHMFALEFDVGVVSIGCHSTSVLIADKKTYMLSHGA